MLSKLKDWGVIKSYICLMCWSTIETEEHPFYNCRAVKQLWQSIKTTGYGRAMTWMLEQELQWILNINATMQIQNNGVKYGMYIGCGVQGMTKYLRGEHLLFL